jgi:hypothetical protein
MQFRQIDAGGRCNETEGVSSMRVSFALKSPHAVIVESAVTAPDRRRVVAGIGEMAHRARGHLGRRDRMSTNVRGAGTLSPSE